MAEKRKTYSDKLRDPRWQKLRLEVFKRDNWTCQQCDDNASTLAVHHKHYIRGKEPWEYQLDDLVTVCEDCHNHEYQYRADIEAKLLEACKASGLWAQNLESLCALIRALRYLQEPGHLISVLHWVIRYPEQEPLKRMLVEEFRKQLFTELGWPSESCGLPIQRNPPPEKST